MQPSCPIDHNIGCLLIQSHSTAYTDTEQRRAEKRWVLRIITERFDIIVFISKPQLHNAWFPKGTYYIIWRCNDVTSRMCYSAVKLSRTDWAWRVYLTELKKSIEHGAILSYIKSLQLAHIISHIVWKMMKKQKDRYWFKICKTDYRTK